MTEHSRGRLLMLADTAVANDSRLQKQARGAAASGWDVTVLGRAVGASQTEWNIGEASVRLIPVDGALSKRRVSFRRSWRHPLAYPPGHTRDYRVQSVKAQRADLDARRAGIDVAARRASGFSAAGVSLSKAVWTVADFAARSRSGWVRLRERQTASAAADDGAPTAVGRAAVSTWTLLRGKRSWRRVAPGLWDAELAFAEIVDGYSPEVIHASGFQMLGVGAHAKIRARAAGRDVALVWDAHEPLTEADPWVGAVRKAYEAEHLVHADAVVTASDELAALLHRRHRLVAPPTVVLDAPELGPMSAVAGVRKRCGIGSDARVVVYCGDSNHSCGLDLLVRALPGLPDVHAVFATDRDNSYMDHVRMLAADLDVVDRVHLLPTIPTAEQVSFLAGADVGVLPPYRTAEHEVRVPEEFFAYAHARVPTVVSDVRAMARIVRRTGCGEVFWDRNLNDFVRALRLVLSDLDSYRSKLDRSDTKREWNWRSQSELLESVYIGVMRRVTGQFAIHAPMPFEDSPGPEVPDSDTMAPHG